MLLWWILNCFFLLLPLAMLVALVLGVMGFIRARDLELRVQLLEAELARRGRQQAAVKPEVSPVADAAQPAPAVHKPAADAQDEIVVPGTAHLAARPSATGALRFLCCHVFFAP